jgi:hypothetical protein
MAALSRRDSLVDPRSPATAAVTNFLAERDLPHTLPIFCRQSHETPGATRQNDRRDEIEDPPYLTHAPPPETYVRSDQRRDQGELSQGGERATICTGASALRRISSTRWSLGGYWGASRPANLEITLSGNMKTCYQFTVNSEVVCGAEAVATRRGRVVTWPKVRQRPE